MEIPTSIRARLRERARDAAREERAEAREGAELDDRRRRLRSQAERVMAFVRALVRSGEVRGRVPLVRWERPNGHTVWRIDERGVVHLSHRYKAHGAANEAATVEQLLSRAQGRRLREAAEHIERGTIWREMERALDAEPG